MITLYEECMEIYYTPEIHLVIVKSLLEVLCKTLDENNIEYFIEGGTLLGAVRHQDIIPWDDDADIGILEKDFSKLPNVLKQIQFQKIQFENETYQIGTVETTQNLYKIYVPSLWAKTEFNRIIGTPTVDIFKYRKKHDKIELASPSDRKQFPNSLYYVRELYPLKEFNFGTMKVKGANDPIAYLHRYYGLDCLTKGKIDMRTPNEKSALDKARNEITFELK